jgi:hypothetical protein
VFSKSKIFKFLKRDCGTIAVAEIINGKLLLLLTVIQCKQRYIRTSLSCNVTVVDLKYFFRFPKLLNSL